MSIAPASRHAKYGNVLTILNIGALLAGAMLALQFWRRGGFTLLRTMQARNTDPTPPSDATDAPVLHLRPVRTTEPVIDITDTTLGAHDENNDADDVEHTSDHDTDDQPPTTHAFQQSHADAPIVIDIAEFDPDPTISIIETGDAPSVRYYGPNSGHHHH